MESGLVFNLQRYSIQDGPGIRTTVFLKGCPLSCWWCHNPESQSPEPEIIVLEGRCTGCGLCRQACPRDLGGDGGADGTPSVPATLPRGNQCAVCGACAAACPSEARQVVGRRVTVAEVLAEVLKDRIFYDGSGGGVTFSGGEPLMQTPFLLALLEACRSEAVHTAVDTCGFASRDDLLAAAQLTDLFLYDLKAMDDPRHVLHTGVSNAAILDNLTALGQVHRNIWIRVPVVPGFNDDPDELDAIVRFAASVPGVCRVSLLAYHRTGVQKAANLGRPSQAPTVAPLSPDQMEQAAQRLRGHGIPVEVGA